MIVIGIDNGLSGGICAISRHSGEIIAKTPMPTVQREREMEIDAALLVRWIKSTLANQDAVIFIEACPPHAQQKSTMRSMGISYGIIAGAIRAALSWCEVEIIRSGNPLDSWQKILLGKQEKGGNKTAALKLATEIWPDESFVLDGCWIPNTGMIDAALIAHHGRNLLRERLGLVPQTDNKPKTKSK